MSQAKLLTEEIASHSRLLIECLADTFRFKNNRVQIRKLAKESGEGRISDTNQLLSNSVVHGVRDLAAILVGSPELALEFLRARQTLAGCREEMKSRLYYPIVLIVLAGIAFTISAIMVIDIESTSRLLHEGAPNFSAIRRSPTVIESIVAPELGLTLARTVMTILMTSFAGIAIVRILGGPAVFAWFCMVIPLAGNWGKNQLSSEFLRTVGTLIKRDISLPEALRISGMISESYVGKLLGNAMACQIEKGGDFASILRESKLFPRWLPDWVNLKPVKGGLGEQLTVAAGLLDEMTASNARLFARVLPFFIFCFAAIMIQYTFIMTFSRVAKFMIDFLYF